MKTKSNLQKQNVQLNITDLSNSSDILKLIEWSKQISASLKKLQKQIDKLNEWVYPK